MIKAELNLEEIKKDCSEIELKILDLYLERTKQKDICKLLGITRGKIDTLVKKYNLTRFRDRNNYSIDESVISLSNPEFCYFLGLFASDGNIHRTNSGSDIVQFTMKDLDVLEHSKRILKYTGEIKLYKKTCGEYYFLGITNKTLVKFLKETVAEENKTFNLKYPIFKDEICELMFIRGFIDGDGSFTVTSTKDKYSFKIYCACESFLNKFTSRCIELCNIEGYYKTDRVFELSGKHSVGNFMQKIYKYKPQISMERKKLRAMQHLCYVFPNKVDDIVRHFNES